MCVLLHSTCDSRQLLSDRIAERFSAHGDRLDGQGKVTKQLCIIRGKHKVSHRLMLIGKVDCLSFQEVLNILISFAGKLGEQLPQSVLSELFLVIRILQVLTNVDDSKFVILLHSLSSSSA